ncbi:hypothetical protein FKM82_019204 [Ascaphus truei]
MAHSIQLNTACTIFFVSRTQIQQENTKFPSAAYTMLQEPARSTAGFSSSHYKKKASLCRSVHYTNHIIYCRNISSAVKYL